MEYPYNKLDKDGNVTTELIPIFLELLTTPHVTPDNRITMSLTITKRDLGSIINAQQSFTTKEATTELLIDDGDTVVIGGIIKTTEDIGEIGLPFLSKLPILGWLFKSKSNSTVREELLIFLTPKIVQLEQHAG
ncbi:MAG: type II and III secretion system protein [Deltaproteobacteria bacterium]|nr:type II and III secretion system protein [Deltaproteobacteria bacterium]